MFSKTLNVCNIVLSMRLFGYCNNSLNESITTTQMRVYSKMKNCCHVLSKFAQKKK